MRFLKEILLFLTTILVNLSSTFYLQGSSGQNLVPRVPIQQNDLSIVDDSSKLSKSDLLTDYSSDSDERQKRQATKQKKQKKFRKGRGKRRLRQQRSRKLRRMQQSRGSQRRRRPLKRRQIGPKQRRRGQFTGKRRVDTQDYTDYDDDDCPEDYEVIEIDDCDEDN
uniref:Uncharacterized protein n=1 Tax=Strongyloides stercoralis TaxID=6248 RepID=A0A0K0EFM2_STRER